jgi:hypothetical protein
MTNCSPFVSGVKSDGANLPPIFVGLDGAGREERNQTRQVSTKPVILVPVSELQTNKRSHHVGLEMIPDKVSEGSSVGEPHIENPVVTLSDNSVSIEVGRLSESRKMFGRQNDAANHPTDRLNTICHIESPWCLSLSGIGIARASPNMTISQTLSADDSTFGV